MGHTHAVFILMEINKRAIRRVALQFPTWRVVILNDRAAVDEGCVVQHRCLAVYLHVDDFGVMGVSSVHCEVLAEAIRADLQRLGFHVKLTPSDKVERYIGLQLESSPARWVPAAPRLAALDGVLRLLARQLVGESPRDAVKLELDLAERAEQWQLRPDGARAVKCVPPHTHTQLCEPPAHVPTAAAMATLLGP